MAIHGNLNLVWQTAYEEVRAQQLDIDDQMRSWERNRPQNHDLESFYQAYVWAVYFTGIKVAVVEANSEEIAHALRGFHIKAIAAKPEAVRTALLLAFGHHQKADAAISTAVWLREHPDMWNSVKLLPASAALTELRRLAYIGPKNCYHIARNVGWDVPMHSGFTAALAENLGTTCERLMGQLAKTAGKRVNTTDTVIGLWSRQHGRLHPPDTDIARPLGSTD